jgi:hypothetical protein
VTLRFFNGVPRAYMGQRVVLTQSYISQALDVAEIRTWRAKTYGKRAFPEGDVKYHKNDLLGAKAEAMVYQAHQLPYDGGYFDEKNHTDHGVPDFQGFQIKGGTPLRKAKGWGTTQLNIRPSTGIKSQFDTFIHVEVRGWEGIIYGIFHGSSLPWERFTKLNFNNKFIPLYIDKEELICKTGDFEHGSFDRLDPKRLPTFLIPIKNLLKFPYE